MQQTQVPQQLIDGTPIAVRPIRSDDVARLHASFHRLSLESRLKRFLTPMNDLSASALKYLCEVDGQNHFAVVATIEEDGEEVIAAVARFIRTAQTDRAEVAIVVGDPLQRRGLGTLLLEVLTSAARSRGVTKFVAHTSASNLAIRRLLERLGTLEPLEPNVFEVAIT